MGETSTLISIIALGLTVIGAIGGLIVRDRQVHRSIFLGDQKMADKLQALESNFVEKLDTLSNRLDSKFATKDELATSLQSVKDILKKMEQNQQSAHTELKEAIVKLDNRVYDLATDD